MTREEMLHTLEQAVEQFNAGDIDRYLETLYAPDVHFPYYPPDLPQGHAGATLYYAAWLAGFPDSRLYLDDLVPAGDRLAVRYHLTATHLGDFNGIPATGKPITLTGITIMRWQNGRVVERWDSADQLGLLRQLGVLPA